MTAACPAAVIIHHYAKDRRKKSGADVDSQKIAENRSRVTTRVFFALNYRAKRYKGQGCGGISRRGPALAHEGGREFRFNVPFARYVGQERTASCFAAPLRVVGQGRP